MKENNVTELLIYWGCQYEAHDKTAYVFKKSYTSQDQIVVVFYGRGNCMHPNKGSIMSVTYYLDSLGQYHGIMLKATDPGAYD